MIKEKDLVREVPEEWCVGSGTICGYYNVRRQFLSALSEYMDRHNLKKEDIIGVSGIGCSGRFTTWQDVVTAHTTHGNASNFAHGVSFIRSMNKKKGLVYVVSGDGDALAIGRENFENLCHSNGDVTYLILNNNIYAMTGGQTAPTTNFSMKTASAPYGSLEKPWDTVTLALESGATFIARVSSYPKESEMLKDILSEAFEHKGTSIVEVISYCQTQNLKDKGKKLSELEKEYLKNSVDIKNFENDFPEIPPHLRYLFIKNYLANRLKKDVMVKGVIYKAQDKSYCQLLTDQKKEVQKLYEGKKLGSRLENLLSDRKIEPA